MILLCYQLYTGFSGSSMIDQMYLMVFNLLFTSIPPIIVGIYDQDAPAEVLLSQPQLYAQGRESRLYKSHSFWINIVDAIYQAIVLFFFAAVVSIDRHFLSCWLMRFDVCLFLYIYMHTYMQTHTHLFIYEIYWFFFSRINLF